MILSHSQSPTDRPSQNKSCLSAETGVGTAGKKIERKGGSVLKCTVDIYCMWKSGGKGMMLLSYCAVRLELCFWLSFNFELS